MYIAGTRDFHDVLDDLRLPFRQAQSTQRYMDAAAVLASTPVHQIVGHSLGGAVAAELANFYALPARVLDAPLFRPLGLQDNLVHAIRHPFDPVSMFDMHAETREPAWYPHSYRFNDYDAR